MDNNSNCDWMMKAAQPCETIDHFCCERSVVEERRFIERAKLFSIPPGTEVAIRFPFGEHSYWKVARGFIRAKPAPILSGKIHHQEE